MASTITQTLITSSPSSTQPATETSSAPPIKKQKCLGFKSVTDIQRILECPICYKTPDCPDDVHFCSNGHLVCDGCYKNILDEKCPVCRSEDWNGQNLFVRQILSALPKLCPFPGCEIQLESKDMNKHKKNCQYRLIDCISKWSCQIKMVTFNDSLVNHLQKDHFGKLDSNTDGYFQYNIKMQESDFEIKKNRTNAGWIPRMTEFDSQMFIARCYQRKKLFYLQVFINENLEMAEKYSCKITMANVEDSNCNMTLCLDVISVDVPTDDNGQENHSGTFSLTKPMLRKFVFNNGNALNIGITIIKKNIK